MTVVKAGIADIAQWTALRCKLWPDCDEPTCQVETAAILADENQAAFIAKDDAGVAIGFAEFSLHPFALGCHTTPVAYFEGWWVDSHCRRRGVGAALLCAGEAWARELGCRELASDTWADNRGGGMDAHRALGFVETGRLVHYRKPL